MIKPTAIVEAGKFVALTYTISDPNGAILEYNDVPTGYIHGGPQTLLGGMEDAIVGKKAGDIVESLVKPEQGFGSYDPGLTFTDDVENVPEQFRHVGAEVAMQNDAGETKIFWVTNISNGRLTVDGNHPMAGKTLQVQVRILEVRDPTPMDFQSIPGSPMYH